MLTTLVMLLGLQGPEKPVTYDPPTDADVLRAMPRVARGLPFLFEVYRDDIVITKNALVSRTIALRLPGGVRANLLVAYWECVVCFKETVSSQAPVPFQVTRNRLNVVYIDHARFVK